MSQNTSTTNETSPGQILTRDKNMEIAFLRPRSSKFLNLSGVSLALTRPKNCFIIFSFFLSSSDDDNVKSIIDRKVLKESFFEMSTKVSVSL